MKISINLFLNNLEHCLRWGGNCWFETPSREPHTVSWLWNSCGPQCSQICKSCVSDCGTLDWTFQALWTSFQNSFLSGPGQHLYLQLRLLNTLMLAFSIQTEWDRNAFAGACAWVQGWHCGILHHWSFVVWGRNLEHTGAQVSTGVLCRLSARTELECGQPLCLHSRVQVLQDTSRSPGQGEHHVNLLLLSINVKIVQQASVCQRSFHTPPKDDEHPYAWRCISSRCGIFVSTAGTLFFIKVFVNSQFNASWVCVIEIADVFILLPWQELEETVLMWNLWRIGRCFSLDFWLLPFFG